jgi:hypothetical protein
MEFPTIDGHFWIVRNGEILDIEFQEYSYIKKVRNCDDGMVYKEADAVTQMCMINIWEKCLTSQGLDKYSFKYKVPSGYFPQMCCCFQNCMMMWEKGDVLKFGSMGWKKKNRTDTWWEFGGENYIGVKAFLK